MANLQTLTAKVELDTSGFTKALNNLRHPVRTLSTSLNKAIGSDMFSGAIKQGKDFGRVMQESSNIVRGILIAQTFYSGLRVIEDATSAAWDFTTSLEETRTAFSNMFQDAGLANELVNVLQDFSAVTPFGFTEAEKAARRLLAYGIESKNVMYVMEGIMNASTMQRSAQTLETVSRVIGQIYSKGKITAREVNSLATAGIPVYQILSEKLGMTAEDFEQIAKSAVPAHNVINALVEGMNERFSSVADAATMTFNGMVANIKDNLLILAEGGMQPIFDRARLAAMAITNLVQTLRQLFETGGFGAIFEHFIPESMQTQVRTLIANLLNLWNTIKLNAQTFMQLLGPSIVAVTNALNLILPVVNAVLNTIANLTYAIQSNETYMRALTVALTIAATAWGIFRVKAVATIVIAGVLKTIAAAVNGLVSVLHFLAVHPVWAVLLGIGAVILTLTGSWAKLTSTVGSYFKTLTSFSGVDPDKILLPEQKERTADVNKFNKALSATSKNMDDLSKNTSKAAKAAKSLLSFDEVFKLKEPDEKSDDDGPNPWDDFEPVGDIPSGNVIPPTLPDIGGTVKDFFTRLKEAFGGIDWSEISKLIAAGIVAALTLLLTHNPLLAALAGMVTWLIAEIMEGIKTGDWEGVATALGATLATAILAMKGNPLLAAGVFVVGWLIDAIIKSIKDGNWERIAPPLATGLTLGIGAITKAGIGTTLVAAALAGLAGWLIQQLIVELQDTGKWSGDLSESILGLLGASIMLIAKKGIKGAALGAGIGLLAGNLVDTIISGINDGDWSGFSTSLLGLIGAAIGIAKNGIRGGLVGIAIGTLSGALIDFLGEKLGLSDETRMAMGIGTTITAALSTIAKKPGDYGIAAAAGLLATACIASVELSMSEEGNWHKTGATFGATLGVTILQATKSLKIGGLATLLATSIGLAIGSWKNVWDAAEGDLGTIGAAIKDWFINGIKSLFNFEWTNNWLELSSGFFKDAVQAFKDRDWAEMGMNIIKGILAGITAAVSLITEPIAKFFKGIWDGICDLFGINSPAKEMGPLGLNIVLGILDGFVKGIPEVLLGIATFPVKVIAKLAKGFVSIGKEAGKWFADVGSAVKDFVTEAGGSIKDWALGVGEKAIEVKDTVVNAVGDWVSNTGEKIKTWAGNAKDAVVGFATAAKDKVVDYVINAKEGLLILVDTTADVISTWAINAKNAIVDFAISAKDNVVDFAITAKDRVVDFTTNAGSKIAAFATGTADKVKTWWSTVKERFDNLKGISFSEWATTAKDKIVGFATSTADKIKSWWTDVKERFSNFKDTKFGEWANTRKESIVNWAKDTKDSIKTWWTDVKGKFKEFTDIDFKSWARETLDTIKSWAKDVWGSIKDNVGKAVDKVKDLFTSKSKNGKIEVSASATPDAGHAIGGIFNREHVARFAEGNKAEAVIPLENASAMEPFVNAIANGVTQGMLPSILAMSNNTSSGITQTQMQEDVRPLYVGTLIADERSLVELQRRLNVIQISEQARGGVTYGRPV